MSDPKKIIVAKASVSSIGGGNGLGKFKPSSIKQGKRKTLAANRLAAAKASKTRKGRCGSCRRTSAG